MRACAITNVGVVVDCMIMRPATDDQIPLSAMHQEAAAAAKNDALSLAASRLCLSISSQESSSPIETPRPLSDNRSSSSPAVSEKQYYYRVCLATDPNREVTVHSNDLLPFGFESPTELFSKIGRHTTKGLVSKPVNTEQGIVTVIPYPSSSSYSSGGGGGGDTLPQESRLARLRPPIPYSMTYESKQAAREGNLTKPQAATSRRLSLKARRASSTGAVDSLHQSFFMPEVQLLPMLSASRPTSLLPVGTAVLARRSGVPSPLTEEGVICRSYYSGVYDVMFEDGQVERHVLHNDVCRRPTPAAPPSSFSHTLPTVQSMKQQVGEEEDVRPRDRVTVTLTLTDKDNNTTDDTFGAIVVTCCGGGWYTVWRRAARPEIITAAAPLSAHRGASPHATPPPPPGLIGLLLLGEEPPHASSTSSSECILQRVSREAIVHIAPTYEDSFGSPYASALLPIFRTLDVQRTGRVAWYSVVKLLNQSEWGGQPITTAQWTALHSEVAGKRDGTSAAELFRSSRGVQEAVRDTETLSFAEFEYLVSRIVNMKW